MENGIFIFEIVFIFSNLIYNEEEQSEIGCLDGEI
jgi:hypothetical protein